MKKIIAALLVAALTLTMFAACSKKAEESPSAPTTQYGGEKLPEFPVNKGVKEYKNADGEVVYKVDYNVPFIEEETYGKYSADVINKLITDDFLNETFASVEARAETEKLSANGPSDIKISHEIKYRSDNLLSVVFTTAYSSQYQIVEARTFNLKDGTALNAEQLFAKDIDGTKANLMDYFKGIYANIIKDVDLTPEQIEEKLETEFYSINFYITDSYISFIYNESDFKDGVGLGAGIYEFIGDWNSLASIGFVPNPEDIFAE